MLGSCILKLIGIGAIGWFLFSKFTNKIYDGISFEKARLKWGSINLNGISVTVILRYFNANGITIPTNEFEGQLINVTSPLARIKLPTPESLASNFAKDMNI